jgi:hypothetical protein
MVLPNEHGAGEDGARLAAILNSDEGFPIPPSHLSTASGG